MRYTYLQLALAWVFLYLPYVKSTQEVVIFANSTTIEYHPPGVAGWQYAAPSSTTSCGGDYMYSMDSYSDLVISFNGIAISLTMMKFENGALASIELDGVAQATVDTFSRMVECNAIVFSKSNLTDGPHKLRIADATHETSTWWIIFKQVSYTEYTAEDRAAMTSSISSVASVSTASLASISSVSITSSLAAVAASQQAERDNAKKRRDRGIAGGVVGGVVGLALFIGVMWFVLRRKQKGKHSSTDLQGAEHGEGKQWEEQASPNQPSSQLPTQTGTTSGPMANFGVYPASALSYQQAEARSSPPASPVSGPTKSRFGGQGVRNMASAVANMVTTRMRNQPSEGGAGAAPADEVTSPSNAGIAKP